MSDTQPTADPSGRQFYPEGLKQREWWVNWVLAVRREDMTDGEPDSDAHPTKQPIAPYDQGNARPARWNESIPAEEHPRSEYETVAEWNGMSVGLDVPAPDRVLSDEIGVGIIQEPAAETDGRPVTLLDWDDVRDSDTGEVHPVCAFALDAVDTYAEVSQSGEGIHQFVYGKVPGSLRQFLRHIDSEPFVGDDRPMIEMYSGTRLTAMTGRHVAGSGDDLADGQDLIDELCHRFGDGTNNSSTDPTDPFASSDTAEDGDVPSTATVADELDDLASYDGDSPDEWETDRPVKYAAVLRVWEADEKPPNIAHWQMMGYAAALGYAADMSRETVISDLSRHEPEKRARREVSSVWRKAEAGHAEPPSVETLKRKGLLPETYAHLDELHIDDTLSPKQKWEAWADARTSGALDGDSVVPTDALEHVARDRGMYDFDALPADADELPTKAHNRALYWVENRWPKTTDEIDADELVTARAYRDRTDAPTRTWEDVRYVYDESKEHGRRAARALLQERYHFMTVDEEDMLYVYDSETGVFTDELGDVRAEIYDGLDPSGHWSRHEKNEIMAGLKQTNVVQQRHTNAGDRAGQLRCVANGVLDVVNRELHDHDPAFRFTRRIPVEYDPQADAAPYRGFVDSLVGRDADRQALFEMVGHALLPEANEHHRLFLMLTGDTTNGKSEFFNRVRALLNGPEREESNTASVKMSKLAQNRFSQHAVYGAAANIAGEVNGKKIRNTANLKDMTGGDSVELEPKGQSSFFDTVNATQMFAANDPPIIGERDKEAIAKRIVPVELPYTFVENPQSPDEREAVPQSELKAELETPEALSGFLNLALEGVQRLEDNEDVSLPESPQERLRQYEKAADPMREFGERCLTSDPNDYVVKADVTTLYKEFAAQRGDEIGQSVGRTLHKVLRGVPDLNYTESRPESPDYTDTSLPLEGWDERKRVVARCSLTEEGMEYAREAGLVKETTTDATGSEVPLSPSEVTVESANARGRLPAIEATVTALYQDRYDNATATLSGDDGVLDATVLGDGTHPELVEGERVRVVGAKATTDDLGNVAAEIRPDAEAVALSSFSAGDDDGSEAAAADGGTDAATADTADAPRPDSDAETAADDTESDATDSGGPDAPTNVETLTVVPNETVGEITGVDGRDYEVVGGEPVELPVENAETLIKQGAATEVSNSDSVESVRGRVLEWIRTHEPQTVAAPGVAAKDEIDAPPDVVAEALAALAEERRLLHQDPEVGPSGSTGYRVDT